MTSKQCQTCGGPLIDLYKGNHDERITKVFVLCPECHTIVMDGDTIKLEEHVSRQFESVSEQQDKAAQKAVEELASDPSLRIHRYFENVFKWAFTEGVVRGYAMFRHVYKSGRYRRIAKLWKKGNVNYNDCTFSGLCTEELQELDKLIAWTASEIS